MQLSMFASNPYGNHLEQAYFPERDVGRVVYLSKTDKQNV